MKAMMGVVRKILKKPPTADAVSTTTIDSADRDLVNKSTELLKSTTMEVTKAATDVICALESKKGRKEEDIKNNERVMACFNIFNTASDAVAILNNSGLVVFCNDSFLRVFNRENSCDIINNGIEELFGVGVFSSLNRYGIWTGDIHGRDSIVMPIRNGSPESVYYICTLR
jgi:PAS domain-containing protein